MVQRLEDVQAFIYVKNVQFPLEDCDGFNLLMNFQPVRIVFDERVQV